MREKFEQQLQLLNTELIQMGALCEEAISSAAKALLDGDSAQIKTVRTIEQEINQKERDIESLCLKLLLQQQPVAMDLRMISSALKMISDMERIGDQSTDIAELTKYVGNMQVTSRIHISDMVRATINMVVTSIDSFVKKDLDLARSVMEADDIVDGLFDQVKKELIELNQNNSEKAELGLDLLMVAKYLERIGDHATNIAEWVEYSITGLHPNSQ